MRNHAILGFTVGYVFTCMLFVGLGYFITMPFGYGYIGAEATAGYLAFNTAYHWEAINHMLNTMLEQQDL